MTRDDLAELYPRLYHMAEEGTWPSIRRVGLLSTSALLDRFEINGKQRNAIERTRRPESVRLTHAKHGTAVIRDQKPMSESALQKCLQGLSAPEWYEVLNSRVFFWLSRDRLVTLLKARAYRGKTHCVLTVDTRALLDVHWAKVTLSPINSGSTVYNPQPRGTSTFTAIEDYPFDHWRKKRGRKKAVVELAVDYSVPEIREFTVHVAHMRNGAEIETLFRVNPHPSK